MNTTTNAHPFMADDDRCFLSAKRKVEQLTHEFILSSTRSISHDEILEYVLSNVELTKYEWKAFARGKVQ